MQGRVSYRGGRQNRARGPTPPPDRGAVARRAPVKCGRQKTIRNHQKHTHARRGPGASCCGQFGHFLNNAWMKNRVARKVSWSVRKVPANVPAKESQTVDHGNRPASTTLLAAPSFGSTNASCPDITGNTESSRAAAAAGKGSRMKPKSNCPFCKLSSCSAVDRSRNETSMRAAPGARKLHDETRHQIQRVGTGADVQSTSPPFSLLTGFLPVTGRTKPLTPSRAAPNARRNVVSLEPCFAALKQAFRQPQPPVD